MLTLRRKLNVFTEIKNIKDSSLIFSGIILSSTLTHLDCSLCLNKPAAQHGLQMTITEVPVGL